MPERRRAAGTGLRCRALLWRRFDFRESSRIVVLLTREHGRVQALAKGAYRPDSPLLGRLDFLNELDVRLSADRGGLRLLLAAELVRERRGLRAPARFLCASHLVELCDFGFPAERTDAELFDLCTGGLALLERCPEPALAQVVLGLELRLLAHLGALPDLERCGDCGCALDQQAFVGDAGGLACRAHAAAPRRAVAPPALRQLRELLAAPGRGLPDLALGPLRPSAIDLPARWLLRALEKRGLLRRHVFHRRAARPVAVRGMESEG
jgi:DNA repair protein RecO (recombination protein O)